MLVVLLLSTMVSAASAQDEISGPSADTEPYVEAEANLPQPVPMSVSAPPATELKYMHELPAKRLLTRFSSAPNSDSSALTLYVKKGINSGLAAGGTLETGYFEPLCHAPCEFSLRSDTHVFGVTSAGKSLIKLDRELHVKRGEGVVVQYRNRIGLRIAGWVVLLGSVGAGSALIALGQPQDQAARTGLIVGGSVLGLLGLVGGLWMANLPDRATGWVDHSAPPATR